MNGPFTNRNFRRLFAGRVVTNAGDSLYFIAAMWLVYELTGDPFYSGVAGFLTLAPSGLQAFFGPLVDKWDLRRLLVATQAIQAVVILALPAAAFAGVLSAPLVLVVMPVLATLNQFVYPAQSAALPRIVEDDELVGANSAFALAYQGIDSVFNALGGVLIALVGAVTLFVIDSVTFAVAALLFATLAVPAADTPDEEAAGPEGSAETDSVPVSDGGTTGGYLADLVEGIDYLRGTFLVLLIGGTLVINFALGTMNATMPAYADGIGGPESYGLLLATLSGGVFVGAAAASWFERYPVGPLYVAGFLFSGVSWVAAIAVDWLPVTALLLGLAGIPVGIANVLINSLVQSVTPDHLLGRVTAVLGSVSSVTVPLGALVGGVAASAVGPVTVMFVTGAGFLFLGVYVLAIPTLRTLPTVSSMDTLSGARSQSQRPTD